MQIGSVIRKYRKEMWAYTGRDGKKVRGDYPGCE